MFSFSCILTFLQISELVKSLEELQTKLPPSLHKPIPPVPVIKPEEVPERRYHYTKETLLKFKEEKKAKEEAERQAAIGAGDGFFGGFGGGGEGEGEGGGENGEQDKKEEEKEEVEQDRTQQLDDAHDTLDAVCRFRCIFHDLGKVCNTDCTLHPYQVLKIIIID